MEPCGIYVHIPFCVKKCAYCDFLSFPAGEDAQAAYVDSLAGEILREKGRWELEVSTVFFGGGTPSLLPAGAIARILHVLRETFPFGRDVEITVECNPGTLDAKKLASYLQAGVNRLSIGLQSASDGELALLGRIHTWDGFLRTFSLARDMGFSNINVDLMFGLPGQTAASWGQTLGKVRKLRPEHLSAYGLMVAEGTPFFDRYGADAARREKGETSVFLPQEEEERAMYRLCGELLRNAGYARYEIANFALPGKACRHNLGYWRRTPYLGFGLGAASFAGNARWSNNTDFSQYLAGNWKGEAGMPLSVSEQMEEVLFLGLRMEEGVSEAAFAAQFQTSIEQAYGPVLEKWRKLGLLARESGRVFLTDAGIDVSNQIFASFLR